VIAATNRNLRQEVNARQFRSDLYYRLAVLEIAVPPLRQRPEDLPLLIANLLDRIGGEHGAAADRLAHPALLAQLQRHSWPGTVRGLRHSDGPGLASDGPPPLADADAAVAPTGAAVDPTQPLRVERERWLRRFEHEYLEKLLALHDGNVSAAARAAGID